MLKTIRTLKLYRESKKLINLDAELICLKARKNLMDETEYVLKEMGIECAKTMAASKVLKLAKKLGIEA